MKRFIILLGLVVSLTTYAQDGVKETAPLSLSLQQAIDYAMQNQVLIKNALIDEQIAKQKVNEITGLGLPQINSSFDVKDFLEIPTSLIPAEIFGGPPGTFAAVKFGTKYQATAGLDASQLLFSGDYFLGLKASKVFVELSTQSTQRTKIDLSTLVTKAYYTILISQERLTSLNATITRIKKTLDDTKSLFDNGFAEKIDVDRLTVSYNNQLSEQENTTRVLDLMIYALKYQIGLDMKAPITLTDKLSDVKIDAALPTAADKFDYEKRIEYNLFETQFKLAKLDLKRNKFAYFPTAAAYGSLSGAAYREQFNIFNTDYGWFPTALIGAKVTMPIFSGLQRHARTQQAKLKLMQAQNNLDFMKQTIDHDLITTLVNLQNAVSSLEIQKKNLALAEDVARTTKIKYDQGVGSNLEVVTAETSLKESQANYYNALFNTLLTKVDFDKANGNIK